MSNTEERHPPIKNSPKKRVHLYHFKWLGTLWNDAANYKRCFGGIFRALEHGATYDELKAATINANAQYFIQLIATTWKSPDDIRFPIAKEEEQFLRFSFLVHLQATFKRIKIRKIHFELLLPIYEEPSMSPEYVEAMDELKRNAPYWASEATARRLVDCIRAVCHSEPERTDVDELRKAIGCNVGRDFLNFISPKTNAPAWLAQKKPEEFQKYWHLYREDALNRMKSEDFEPDRGHPGGRTPLEDQRTMALEAVKCSDALWTIASGEEAARTLVKGAISLGVGKEELLSHVESPVGRRFVESCFAVA